VQAYATESTVRAVIDRQGNVQAVAVIRDYEVVDAIYIDFLVAAPWNPRLIQDERSTEGTPVALVAQIDKESLDRGFGGTIKVSVLSAATLFYERLGFEEVGDGEYRLSPIGSRPRVAFPNHRTPFPLRDSTG